jgi:hypothetical protein
MWLGPYKALNFKSYYRQSNTRLLQKIKVQNQTYSLNKYRTPHDHVFYAPNNWKLSILKGNMRCLYFLSGPYFFSFSIPNKSLKIRVHKQLSSLTLYSLVALPDTRLVISLLNNLISTFSNLFFLKLKFKGKGYYLYKNSRNTITPQFGYAHRIYKYNYIAAVKFLSKTKIFFFGMSKADLYNLTSSVKSMRPINVFTGRGVRFAKAVVYKKTGKVSSYR